MWYSIYAVCVYVCACHWAWGGTRGVEEGGGEGAQVMRVEGEERQKSWR